jgi:hypothetical protein
VHDDPSREDLASEYATLAMLASLESQHEPPASLRQRVLSAVRGERFQSVYGNRGVWLTVADAPGVKEKILYSPSDEGKRTSLVKVPSSRDVRLLDPARDPAVFVVNGAVSIDGAPYETGDYIEAGDRTRVDTADGATLLVIERGSRATPRPRAVRSSEGAWHQLGRGTRIKPLAGGADERTDVMLLEMDPGSVLPEHHHAGLEEIFLLRGDCVAQGQSLAAGDYHRAYEDTDHEETATVEGCLMLVIVRRAA